MRLFLDSSVFVAALVNEHLAHAIALPWLNSVLSGAHTGVIAAHSLAEVYATITRIESQRKVTPSQAFELIKENVLGAFEVVALTPGDYIDVLGHLANLGIAGGTVYDGLLVRAAALANADRIVTLNKKHFVRVDPALAHKIISPEEERPN